MFGHSGFCSNHINDQTNKKNIIYLTKGLHTLYIVYLSWYKIHLEYMKRLCDVTLYIQTLESYSKACDEPDMDNVLTTIQFSVQFCLPMA